MDPAAMEAMLRRVGRVEAPVRCRASIHSTQAAHAHPFAPNTYRPFALSRAPGILATEARMHPARPRAFTDITRSARSPLSHSFPTASLSLYPYPPYPIPLVGTPRATLRWHYRRPTRIPLQSRVIDALCPLVVYGARSRCKDISPSMVRCALCTAIVWSSATRVAGSFTSYLNVYL